MRKPATPNRWRRRVLTTTFVVTGVLVVAIVAAVLALLNPRFSTPIARWAVGRVHLYPGASLQIERFDLGHSGDIEIAGVRLVERDSAVVVASLGAAKLQLRLRPLLGRSIVADSIRLVDPVIDVDRLRAGLATREPQQADTTAVKSESGGFDLRIGVLEITGGSGAIPLGGPGGPKRLDVLDLDLQARDLATRPRFSVDLESLAAHLSMPRSPRPATVTVAGRLVDGIATVDSLRLYTATSHVSLRGRTPVFAGVDSLLANLVLDLEVNPIDATDLTPFVAVPPEGGAAVLALHADLHGTDPSRIDGTTTFDIASAHWGSQRLAPTRLTTQWTAGLARLDLAGGLQGRELQLSGTVRPLARPMPFDFTLAAPAGAAGVAGQIDWQSGPSWILQRATTRGLDLATIAPAAPSTSLDLEASGRGSGFAPRTMTAQATLDAGRSVFGHREVDRLHVEARIDSGRVSVDAQTAAGPARVDVVAVLRPFVAPLEIERAQVRFQNLDLARWAAGSPPTDLTGRLDIDGRNTDPGARRAAGRLLLSPSQCGDQPIESADLQVQLAGEEVRAAGDIQFPDGELRLAARGRVFGPAARRAAIDELCFSGLDPGAILARASLRMQLNGCVRGEIEGRTLQDLTGWTSVELDSTRYRDFDLARLRAEANIDAGVLRSKGALRLRGGDGEFDVHATLAGDSTTYRGEFVVRADDVTTLVRPESLGVSTPAPADSVRPRVNLQIHAEGRGIRRDDFTLQGTISGDGSWQSAQVDTIALAVQVATGRLHVDSLLLRSNVARLQGGGSLLLADWLPPEGDSLVIRGAIADARPLGRLLGGRIVDLEQGVIDVALRRNGEDANLTASLRGREAAYGAYTAQSLAVTAEGKVGPRLRPLRLHAAAVADTIRLGTRLVTHVGIAADLDTALVDAHVVVATADGSALRLAAHGAPRVPGAGVLDTLAIDFAGSEWRLAQPTRIAYGRRIDIEDLRISAGDQSIAVGGVLDPDSTNTLALRVRAVEIAPFAALVGLSRLRGNLDAAARVEGAGAAARLSAQAALHLQAQDQAVEAVLDLEQGHRQLVFGATVRGANNDSLTMRGNLPPIIPGPFAPVPLPALRTSPVELRIRAEQFALDPLEMLFSERTVRDLGGRMTADLAIRGDLAKPVFNGDVTITGGIMDLVALGTPYKEIELAANVTPERLHVERLSVHSGKGRLDASGDLGGQAGSNAVTLHAVLNRFRTMRARDMQIDVSGDLALTGTLLAPVVRGSLLLQDNDIDVSGETSRSSEAVQLTDADWEMLQQHFGYRPQEKAEKGPSLFAAADLDVDVRLGRDVWLRRRRNPRVAIELQGNVDLRKEPSGTLQVFGRLDAVPRRSSIEQYGRRLDVDKGTVVLNGNPTDARVDLVTKYEVASVDNPSEADVTVNVAVRGPLDDLRMELSSDPAMSEGEIVRTLVTGRAPAGVGSSGGDEASEAGAGLAAGQASMVVEEMGSGLGLDVLQIRPDGVTGATLVAGRYANPRTYLGMRQSVSFDDQGTDASSSTQNTEIEVEYELLDWLLVNLQGGVTDIRLLLKSKYEY